MYSIRLGEGHLATGSEQQLSGKSSLGHLPLEAAVVTWSVCSSKPEGSISSNKIYEHQGHSSNIQMSEISQPTNGIKVRMFELQPTKVMCIVCAE